VSPVCEREVEFVMGLIGVAMRRHAIPKADGDVSHAHLP
jgi:hypothetical protein